MLAGGLSFGIGIGIALVMPAIAWLLLPAGRRASSVVLFTAAAVGVVARYFGQQYPFAALYADSLATARHGRRAPALFTGPLPDGGAAPSDG